jgi:hypothetical protein
MDDAFTETRKALLWVMGRMQLLSDAGLVNNHGRTITPKGIAAYDQLVASGFVPSEREARLAVETLWPKASERDNEGVLKLLFHYAE